MSVGSGVALIYGFEIESNFVDAYTLGEGISSYMVCPGWAIMYETESGKYIHLQKFYLPNEHYTYYNRKIKSYI